MFVHVRTQCVNIAILVLSSLLFTLMFLDELKIAHFFERNLNTDFEDQINGYKFNIFNFAKIWFHELSLNKCFYLEIDLNFDELFVLMATVYLPNRFSMTEAYHFHLL